MLRPSYNYHIQLVADEIARKEHGKEFDTLTEGQRKAIYSRAEKRFWSRAGMTDDDLVDDWKDRHR